MATQAQATEAVRVFEVPFFQGTLRMAAERALTGGLTVAPSAPGLADDLRNPEYAQALRDADLVVPDSGYMVLLWWLLRGERVRRISGLALISALFHDHAETVGREGFWVMPSTEDAAALGHYLDQRGIDCPVNRVYTAPIYTAHGVRDAVLLSKLQAARPGVVIIAIAGGKQEILGAWLRDNLDYRPSIICIGAAIAFLTGRQVHIPQWADRFYLGWLVRLASAPARYGRRYSRALSLAWSINR